MPDKLIIKSGEKVYINSFGGFMKGIYLSKTDNCHLQVRITATKNRVYRRGEIITLTDIRIIPRKCYHKTGIFTYVAYPDYTFE